MRGAKHTRLPVKTFSQSRHSTMSAAMAFREDLDFVSDVHECNHVGQNCSCASNKYGATGKDDSKLRADWEQARQVAPRKLPNIEFVLERKSDRCSDQDDHVHSLVRHFSTITIVSFFI